MKIRWMLTLLVVALAACAVPAPRIAPEPAALPSAQPGLPNPASLYCEQNGNILEIVTDTDGSQSGVCVFPDGSQCDEWAYYRSECGPEAQSTPTPIAPIGTVPTSDAGGNTPGNSMPPGATETVTGWWGIIKSTEPGAQYDDYFERQDLGQVVYFGIDSLDPAVKSQIEALRGSGKIVHLYGTLVNNIPDYNGSQILVERIEVE